ncbi:MAG: STAS domain-containing protein, partial [Lachnospiraceae bacterium]|nr:STAS domain-containing protein [Lachnospiraceae bacterium]
MPLISKVIPGSLVAIIVTTLIVKFSPLDTATIGSVYGELSSKIPAPSIPAVNFAMVKELLPSAFTIAVLAAIESLLSCVVSDGMINSRHRSNMELIGQGIGNIASGLFGGIPATGAIARTAANVKNGGRTPVAGMVHALTLLLILKLFMPYAALIPMTTLAAILIIVAYNMADWKEFASLCKHAPKSDVIVLLVTFFLTVIFDLVVAIEVGIVVASLLFIKRMSDTTSLRNWTYINGYDDSTENDPMHICLKEVPEHTLVYEIDGPMFFGAADKFLEISVDKDIRVVILRMRSVPAIDITALHALEKVYANCEENDVTLVLSHVNEQPRHMMEKAGFIDKIGEQNLRENIDAALEWAAELV